MSIKLIHVSDIHFGSGEGHGKINPLTGLNIRFEDFVKALKKVVDFTLSSQAEVFLFSGDAYKNASPEPIYQKMFAQQLKRLSDAGIPTLLLVGNHDQILRGSGSHSLSVFQSLEVPNVIVLDQPKLLNLKCRTSNLQIIAIPHLTRHILMSQEKYAKYNNENIDRVMISALRDIMEGFYEELDPSIPTIATAHIMLDRAKAGAEGDLLVGYTMTFPLDIFIDKRLDYVALGHVHRHQILQESNPCIAYAGSLERVDFGEENEDKGFIEAHIERGKTQIQFHSINPRKFLTVEANLTESLNPNEDLLNIVSAQAQDSCVMRIKYKISQECLAEIDEDKIRKALPQVLSLRFKAELVYPQQRGRMPDINEQSTSSPEQAIEKYIDEVYPENKELLMAKARELMLKLNEQESSS